LPERVALPARVAAEHVGQRGFAIGPETRHHCERRESLRLREEGQDGPARAAQQLADRAERVGGYLQESDADRILRDAEDFGRRQPLAVVGIGLFLGFAASRLLKASSRSRYERGGTWGGSQGESARANGVRVVDEVPAVPAPATPGTTAPTTTPYPATGV